MVVVPPSVHPVGCYRPALSERELHTYVRYCERVVEHVGLDGEVCVAALRLRCGLLYLRLLYYGLFRNNHFCLLVVYHGWLLLDVDRYETGVAHCGEELAQHVVPCASVIEVHEALLAAVYQNSLRVVCELIGLAYLVQHLVSVRHVRLLYEVSQLLPHLRALALRHYCVGQLHSLANVALHVGAASFGEALVEKRSTFGRCRAAEFHTGQLQGAVFLHVSKELDYFCETCCVITEVRIEHA